MKKLILIMVLVFISTQSLFSQQGWFSTNAPQNINYQSVFFINSETGWASSPTHVYKTTDGGAGWTIVQYDSVNNINSKIYFLDANTGWLITYNDHGNPACGYIGSNFLTTNGGATWTRKRYEYCSRPIDIFFLNANKGFIAYADEHLFGGFVTVGALSITTNGGQTWSSERDAYEFHSVAFKDSLIGYALGYYWDDTSNDTLMLYKTTNSGINWFKYKSISEIAGGSYNLFQSPVDLSVKENNIYIIGTDSLFLRSSNEGANWQKAYYTPYKRHKDLNFVNSNTGWIAFKSGNDTTNIMKTTNGGVNWFNLKNPFANQLNSIMFVNDLTGYAAGNGAIIKSVTGGVTSIQQISTEIPNRFKLLQNYPNPFNGESIIRFSVPKNINSNIKLSIYSMEGKLVEVLANGVFTAGEYEVKWSSRSNASGVYYYKLETGKFSETKKMLLIK